SDSQLTGTGNRDQGAICALDVLQVMQADSTPVLDHNVVNSRRSAGRTTNVERTHGQLGTRFTNGLGSNNAYRLTDVDLMTTCQVTPVALGADTVAGFAADGRTNDNFVDAV